MLTYHASACLPSACLPPCLLACVPALFLPASLPACLRACPLPGLRGRFDELPSTPRECIEQACGTIVAVWTVGGKQFDLPSTAGLPFDADANQYLDLQVGGRMGGPGGEGGREGKREGEKNVNK